MRESCSSARCSRAAFPTAGLASAALVLSQKQEGANAGNAHLKAFTSRPEKSGTRLQLRQMHALQINP